MFAILPIPGSEMLLVLLLLTVEIRSDCSMEDAGLFGERFKLLFAAMMIKGPA